MIEQALYHAQMTRNRQKELLQSSRSTRGVHKTVNAVKCVTEQKSFTNVTSLAELAGSGNKENGKESPRHYEISKRATSGREGEKKLSRILAQILGKLLSNCWADCPDEGPL